MKKAIEWSKQSIIRDMSSYTLCIRYHSWKMEKNSVFCKVKYLILYLLIGLDKCIANDILGCGGFVKSHVTLDYSKIEIGL